MKRKITGYYRDSKLVEDTGMSLTTLWRMRKDGLFPCKVQLSQNISGTPKEEVDDWMQDPKGWADNHGQEVAV